MKMIRAHELQFNGLTVGSGLAPKKTLAKSAQWAFQESPQFRGVLAFTPDNSGALRRCFPYSRLKKSDVGSRISKRLNLLGVETALDLARTCPAFIR